MNTEKVDRRVRYTKKILKESLITLLKQKPIDKISVTELCAHCEINRSTFYAHYEDQKDLLLQIEQEVLDELDSHLARISFSDSEIEAWQLVRRILDYIADNAELCHVLLVENGDMAFQKKLMMYILQQLMREPLSIIPADPELFDFIARFCIDGCIGVVQKWLETDIKKSSAEIAEIIIKLTYQGVAAYQGVK